MSNSVSLYSPEIEQHFLGLLLNNPEIWGEVSMIEEKDFGEVRRPVYQVIRQQLESVPVQPVSPVILVEKLKTYGKTTIGDVDALVYLEGLLRLGRLIEKKNGIEFLKEIKKQTVKRELIQKCEEAKIQVAKSDTLDQMIGAVDKTLTSVNTEYFTTNTFTEVLGDGIIELIEERGNNPQDPNSLGYTGPLPSFNDTFGADLIAPSALTICAARTANGKSAFGFFYCAHVAEKHEIPLLWLDAGEMTVEQIRFRAACCFARGRVPLWAMKSGEWRKDPKWEKIIRQEVWPRVKKIKMYYQGTGGMNPKEKIQFMKRFYYNKVGRGNFLLISDDYLKGIEAMGKNTSEFQSMGYYLSDVKTLITEDIKASYWAGVQANRSGIHQGKKGDDVMDSEAVVSMSDRISHNASTLLLLRFKTTDELAAQKGLFGNMMVKALKYRELSAKNAGKLLKPVKMPDGKFSPNYFNLEFNSFYYEDKGMLSDMLETQGHTAINLSTSPTGPQMP